MTQRLEKLIELIEPCGVFADVGCDHGLVSEAVLDRGIAQKVYAGDISEKSLEKAIKNVDNRHIGRFFAYLSDGFDKMPGDIDEALIAGMGGEEIISVLTRAPSSVKTLVLQPMKNADKVRKYLIENGFVIDVDYTFYDKDKFYDVIRAKKEGSPFLPYTPDEIEFGRGNLQTKSEDFMRFLSERLKEYSAAYEKVKGEQEKAALMAKIEKLREIANEAL